MSYGAIALHPKIRHSNSVPVQYDRVFVNLEFFHGSKFAGRTTPALFFNGLNKPQDDDLLEGRENWQLRCVGNYCQYFILGIAVVLSNLFAEFHQARSQAGPNG
jgi:hypothetical protein